MFPNKSPHGQGYSITRATGLFIYLFIHSFTHSCMYVYWSPQKGALLHMGKKYRVTTHGAPRTRKAYIQWGVAWFPKGIINDTAISTPVPCSILKETTQNVTRRTQVLHLY
jgi:hypothetical protein